MRCIAFHCSETSRKGSLISFHGFPRDPEKRKLWTIAVRRKNFTPSNFSKLCSKHFSDDCFNIRFGARWLHPDAVPTIFDFPPHLRSTSRPEKAPIKRTYTCTSVDKSSTALDVPEAMQQNNKEPNDESLVKQKNIRYLGDFASDVNITPNKRDKKLALAEKQLEQQSQTILRL